MAGGRPMLPRWLTRYLPNGVVRIVLGVLIAFGFAFVVRGMLVRRERKRAAIAGQRPQAALPVAEAEPDHDAAPPAILPAILDASALPPLEPAAPTTLAPEPDDPGAAEGAENGHPLFARPHVLLSGPVDQAMYDRFREQIARAPGDGSLVIALSTQGGDHDMARLMADDVRLLRDHGGRDMLFLGRVAVHAAGTVLMAAFPADKRFLTRGTRVLIQERMLDKTIELSGPLRLLTATLRANLHEIGQAVRVEEEGFRDLVAGTRIAYDEVRRRATDNWYIEADEARRLELVADVI